MTAPAPKGSAQFKPVASAAARRQLLVGVVLMAIGVLAVPIGLGGVALPLLAGGIFLSGMSLYARRVGEGAQLVNRANDTVARGRLAEAEALLVQAGARTRAGYLHRVIDLQRATIALRRGDLQAALKHVDASLSRRLGMMGRAQAKLNVAGGHALRALLRAATGDEKGAREDVGFVRASPEGGPEVLARAELAVAVLLERSGDREALRAHLTGARRLLLEHTQPRERAIVRAFLLAATGRDAQAGAEMALLQETYPAHPYRARAELRVGLLRRIRQGDLAGAAALTASGTEDIPLGLRDETLASVVRAAVHPESAGAGEIERLERELRVDPDLRAWLETVAPTAMSAFAAAEHRRGDLADADVDAEREALAEQEAAEHEAPAREEIGASSS